MDMFDKEIAPYKKKARNNAPKKAKHKHDYQTCIFEYDSVQIDKAHGFVPKKKEGFGRLHDMWENRVLKH